jgi:hypothetical protein
MDIIGKYYRQKLIELGVCKADGIRHADEMPKTAHFPAMEGDFVQLDEDAIDRICQTWKILYREKKDVFPVENGTAIYNKYTGKVTFTLWLRENPCPHLAKGEPCTCGLEAPFTTAEEKGSVDVTDGAFIVDGGTAVVGTVEKKVTQ